jgi:hypothetical protein
MLKPVVYIVTTEFCVIHTSFLNILGFQHKNLQRYLLLSTSVKLGLYF